jgi:DNA polymerase III delta' subunit
VTLAADTAFRGLLGQVGAVEILSSALRNSRVPHAYLFAGPEGVGKRTAFFKWAQALLCESPGGPASPCEDCAACRKAGAGRHPDLFRADFETQAVLLKEPVDKQKTLKIDTVREMEKALRLKPLEGRVKIALLEPADKLVDAAAHALLKILEEPPPATHLVLLAQDPSQLLGTIRSRCQTVRFRPLPSDAIRRALEDRTAAGEPLEVSRFDAVIAQSEGSLGRALALLGEATLLDFDWENASLTELLTWCDQFGGARLGRDAAEDFLKRLLPVFQADVRAGRRPSEDAARVLDALHHVKQFVTPSMVLSALLLRLRREQKRRPQ